MDKEISTEGFYDSLADDYHLVFTDWDKSIQRQANILNNLIKQFTPNTPEKILDCTCGIGTQSLGLSQLGYSVLGTDLSAASIARAKQEANKRNLSTAFEVADLRALASKIQGQFDVLIAFDNALPHLINEEDLLLAVKNILEKMNTNGILIGSIRDYDRLLATKPTTTMPINSKEDDISRITFQTWDWNDNNTYVVNFFTLKGKNNQFETNVKNAIYRAYTRLEIDNILQQAGFKKIEWLFPDSTGFYQPIFIGSN